MKRSSKRLAAIGATIVMAGVGVGVGVASATLAQGGPDAEPSADTRATTNNPIPMETSFVPVKPCRLYDTREAGGPLANAATRDFKVKGALSGQGGAANCGVPVGATAASINLTAISSGGTSGFVRGWAAGGAQVTSTLVNFSPALNASNSVEVPLCEGTPCTKDITLKMFGTADVVGEILGYYIPQIHAELNFDGTIYTGSTRVISSIRTGNGTYEVTFDRSIANCGIGATITSQTGGTITAYEFDGKLRADTRDLNGPLADKFWSFVVAC